MECISGRRACKKDARRSEGRRRINATNALTHFSLGLVAFPWQAKTPYSCQVAGHALTDDLFNVPSNDLSLSLAERLRALRKQKMLTQEKAASLIGCDYKYYQRLEAGAKDVRLSMIERIAKAFDMKASILLDATARKIAG